ncbi:MAG: hypothetical protein M3Y13_12425 [Armatimonadota bacterium]|nr:hypothetical protein [Armatimonadota bacterium]
MNPTLEDIIPILSGRDPLPPLKPTQVYDSSLASAIDALMLPVTVKAGLHLWNDDLASSHALVQPLASDALADYWHALVHRREGDWNNAKYWFGQVGLQPILREIYGEEADAPMTFVDRCRAVDEGRDAELETFQQHEIARLLDYAADCAGTVPHHSEE